MFTFLSVIYVMVCLFLILVVLLQAGKGGGLGAGLSGSSQTVFGGSGAGNFLTRLTAICAALFMILSVTLAYLSSRSEKALDEAAKQIETREEIIGKPPADKDKNTAKATENAPMSADENNDAGAAATDEEEVKAQEDAN